MPYYVQLEGRYQGIHFGEHPPGLEGLRTVSQRQLRDALRIARREREANAKSNVVRQALLYADILTHNPELTKSQLAEDLGISRIRLFQILSILKLPEPILEFISSHDSPEHKAALTERRLRPLTQVEDEAEQLAQFRELLQAGI